MIVCVCVCYVGECLHRQIGDRKKTIERFFFIIFQFPQNYITKYCTESSGDTLKIIARDRQLHTGRECLIVENTVSCFGGN